MADIRFLTGDATAPDGDGPKVIVHVCNDVGAWGAGFVLAVSKRWPEPEARFRAWAATKADADAGDYALGAVQFVPVEPDLWVANIIGQQGLRRKAGVPPIRYEAIFAGLAKVAEFCRAHSASVHMPRIGCGLAGGTWDEIEPIVREQLAAAGIFVTVYDLPAKPRK